MRACMRLSGARFAGCTFADCEGYLPAFLAAGQRKQPTADKGGRKLYGIQPHALLYAVAQTCPHPGDQKSRAAEVGHQHQPFGAFAVKFARTVGARRFTRAQRNAAQRPQEKNADTPLGQGKYPCEHPADPPRSLRFAGRGQHIREDHKRKKRRHKRTCTQDKPLPHPLPHRLLHQKKHAARQGRRRGRKQGGTVAFFRCLSHAVFRRFIYYVARKAPRKQGAAIVQYA